MGLPSDGNEAVLSLQRGPSPLPTSTTAPDSPLAEPIPPFASHLHQSPPSPTTPSSAITTNDSVASKPLARRLPSLDDLPPLPLRPLDYTLLLSSSDGLHSQLAGTVEELSQWLGAIEFGLGSVLTEADLFGADSGDEASLIGAKPNGVVRIPEEDEESDSAEDSLSDTAVETVGAH